MISENARKYENVVIRNEQEIGINNFGLDYMVGLEDEIERLNKAILGLNNCIIEFHSEFCNKQAEINRLNNIIKEVREYITNQKLHKIVDTTGGLTYEERKLLEILDKENK